MRLSHGTRIKSWTSDNGYGYATDQMIKSLHKLEYEVRQNDGTADAEIWFDQPHNWNFTNKKQYKIGYHPWESTDMRKDWKKKMNKCDEIWTPSPVVANWYRNCGIKVPVHVYQHGVDHDVWTPKKRIVDDRIHFLHVGGEALRKGMGTTIKAFRNAFPGRDDVHLTLKINDPHWNLPSWGNTSVVSRSLPLDELVGLYHRSHVFVYPSSGEGFGFNPIQAMATGMPTLVTNSWAPYAHLIPENQRLDSYLEPSPWPDLHPGRMFRHDFDQLVDTMRYTADNYESESHTSFLNSEKVHSEYDWVSLTDTAFKNLETRLKSL